MKRIVIFCSLALVLVLLVLPKKKMAHLLPAVTKIEKDVRQAPAKISAAPVLFQPAKLEVAGVPTTQDLMDSFRTKPTNEIRQERTRILKMAESRNLYGKANHKSMTAADRNELAYVMRANTALSFLLIERELEKN